MKRSLHHLIVGIVALIAATLTANAETHYKPHIWLGGHAGIALSKVSFSPSVSQKMAMASTGAVSIKYTEEKMFGIIGELGWAQRGWAENFKETTLSYTRSLTYLNLSVLTQITFGPRRFKCFVNLGPQLSYMIANSISANFDYTDPYSDPQFRTLTARQTDQLTAPMNKKFDYGIVGGLGFEFFAQPRHSITLEARYYFGLGNILPSSKSDTFGASRNNSIEVALGYNFRIY
ncbi:MAG: porin family protein [Muribaculaceae bacterium]